MNSIRPDFGQPPPGWPSSNGNHSNINNRFLPTNTNGHPQFMSSGPGNGIISGSWLNSQHHLHQSQFHGNTVQTQNNQNCYSYARAARVGNVPPQFHIRNSNSSQQHVYRNTNTPIESRFSSSQDSRISLAPLPLMAGDCVVNDQKHTSFGASQSFGNVLTRPANTWRWPTPPQPVQSSTSGYCRANNNNSQSEVQNPRPNTNHCFDTNRTNSRPIIRQNASFCQSSPVKFNIFNNSWGHVNENTEKSVHHNSNYRIVANVKNNFPQNEAISRSRYNSNDNAEKNRITSLDNHISVEDTSETKVGNEPITTTSANICMNKEERLVIFDDRSGESSPETQLVSKCLSENVKSEEESNDNKDRLFNDNTNKISLKLSELVIEPINQCTNTFNEHNCDDITNLHDSIVELNVENQSENGSDDGDDKENEEQQNQEDNEAPVEKRKFTKSYWRKQRRLRLKERLLAQKALMETNPELVPEERDQLKAARTVKIKEIDYDSFLPSHVLMHVKRDLVSVLMEYGQTREVKVAFEDMERSGPHHASRFHTAAIVDNEKFLVGSGSSKKNAKKAAAAHALKTMYDRGKKNLETVNERAHKRLCAMTPEEVGSHAHRVLLVSRHVLETVEETQFINYSKDKIAATFVLEYHGKMRVVGLGTGNRCILYQHMTKDGRRVIHSHAEVMARRAFLRYLYKQLMNYQGNRAHPIFARSDTGKLKIRDKIQVHLYISRPPCGDAAAFPTISNFPNKMRAIRKQGQLRTIIDDGEGAIPTDFAVPAGANGKERLRIMTCSDKICRWNVLGVQGALLSHYLDPIYINSLVIGSHTGDQRGHVPRAVSGRLKCGRLHEVIQRPYRINSPEIHYPIDELADQYNITKSKQYCITWSYGDTDAEILDAITGLTNMEELEEVVPSRVSKTILYDLFHQVCHKFGRTELLPLDYMKAKKSAITFNRMKSFVGQHLSAMGFGQWYSLQETYGTDNFPCPEEC